MTDGGNYNPLTPGQDEDRSKESQLKFIHKFNILLTYLTSVRYTSPIQPNNPDCALPQLRWIDQGEGEEDDY